MTKEMDENLMLLIVCDGEQHCPLGFASDNVLFPIKTKYNINEIKRNRRCIACCCDISPVVVQPKSKNEGMMRTEKVLFQAECV